MPTTSHPVPRTSVLSEEVKLILDTPPAWIVRWGNVLLLSAIVVLLALASLFPYPRTLNGKAVVAPHGTTVTVTPDVARQLQPGQQVIISLNAFPSEEYGNLTGIVAAAPVVSGPAQATVRVHLTAGYTTTYHKILPVPARSEGSAHIITTDKRMIDRLLDRLGDRLAQF